MAKGFLYGNGGGGLNFTLKTYATEAALLADSPAENTIGIVTDTALGKVCFAMNVPTTISEEAIAAGDVWVVESATAACVANLSKKSGVDVLIYPIGAKQYDVATWVDKTATGYIRTGSAWESIVNYLYRDGIELLGGVSVGVRPNYGGTATKEETSIYLKCANTTYSLPKVWSTEKINLDSFNTVEFTFTADGANDIRYGIPSSTDFTHSGNWITYARYDCQAAGVYTVTTDVSALSGNQYIGFGVYNSTTSTKAAVHLDKIRFLP